MTIKNHIREYRVKNGYTQSQLGDIIGVSKNTISQYELGYFDPCLTNICQLCDIFNCTFEELFEYEPVFSLNTKIVIKERTVTYKEGEIYERVFNGPYL